MKLLSDPRAIAGWQTNTDVLALNPETDENSKLKKKHAFVLNFFGDVRASQAEQLREEVTGLLRSAKTERGDEVVLRLNTGGGTVTGYGLAAAPCESKRWLEAHDLRRTSRCFWRLHDGLCC